MSRPEVFWASTITGLAAFDYWCAKNTVQGDSLSECVRAAFRTHTPAGRIALIVAWGGFTAWVIPHWLRLVDEAGAHIDLPDYD